ncbi:glutathione synthetase-like isoform X1 [Condylostylus longicornis]|uniref:glutathione synthetase-like isoform X1 n=1 Tax=Condylostylus longicornis TaxID=2530218 RepID=UPI00244D9A6F|nr:glutathione synthetase-like isoform X1 [Condylostylus longicornis]
MAQKAMQINSVEDVTKSVKIPILESCIELPIEEETLIELTQKAKDWAIMHGAGMRSKTNFSSDSLNFAPFILTPCSFPRKQFEKALKIQTVLNELTHSIAHDEEFLKKTLAETIKVDEFTGNLYKIYEKILSEGISQDTISVGILRSDYLAQSFEDNNIKQVEINTVASSFGGISTYMKPLQSYVLAELGAYDKLVNLPENNALFGICNAMIKAWEIYGNDEAVILFIIEDISYNICDQRFHEFEIRQMNPKIKVIRKTLTQIYNQSKLGPNKELIVGGHHISVVYFRAGYEPGHYPSQNEWDARLLIERSKAIKCPTIYYHLAGTKKVQQALSEPGMVERFIKDPATVAEVRNIFTGLYPLDDTNEGNAAYVLAMQDPERFVLKPQREGGGNNVYGLDIPDALKKMSKTERKAWILMDRILPPISKGYMIRPGGPIPPPIVDLVSELGIFGAIIGDAKSIKINYMAGHMFRTKISTANEGGVAAGLGALDSPYMVD